MTTEPINLVHKIIQPQRLADGRAPTLVMLHGRGADENDLAALAPRLDPHLFIVSVRAPFTFQYGGFTWYNTRNVSMPDIGMFQKSHTKLSQFIEILPRLYAVNPQKVFVLGFSMGAAMAYALALTAPEKFAGIVVHSGYVPEASGIAPRWKQLAQVPFFVAHGTNDPVIPVSYAQHARELLRDAQADFTYKEYPIAHEISQQSLSDLSAWLAQQIDSPRSYFQFPK